MKELKNTLSKMDGSKSECIKMPKEELLMLRELLNRALSSMEMR